MTDTVNLTIKIDPALKETLKQLALDNQCSMSQEIGQRLQASLAAPSPAADESLATEQEQTDTASDAPADGLSASELKQIRLLLKKQSKKKK